MSELLWSYGPTESDPDPGKMWHRECGGEVLWLDGHICTLCQEGDDDEDES